MSLSVVRFFSFVLLFYFLKAVEIIVTGVPHEGTIIKRLARSLCCVRSGTIVVMLFVILQRNGNRLMCVVCRY